MSHKNKNITAAGCFPAGTRINTPSGYRFIEDIEVGDEVFAFDLTALEPGEPNQQPGRIFKKKVTEVFKHSFGEVGYTSPLLRVSYGGAVEDKIHSGVLAVTGNHFILTPSRQSEGVYEGFARADALEVGDTIWTQYGDAVTVTSIEAGDEYDYVYNFEVEDLHTYIAEGIRVHNGGGGKGKHTPVQSPNTVNSNQVIRVLLSPGEGEIGGLYYGDDIARSVYFDGTPLRNEDGSYNFTNISVEERVGLPDQSIINGFSVVESELLLGQALTAATPIVRTLTSANIDAVRITLEFPQGLQSINKENGDAGATGVSFNIARRNSGGTWQSVFSPTIHEMSSGPFTAAFLMERPLTPGTWEWRATRTTADSSDNSLINATSIKSYTEIQEAETPAQKVKLQYNNRALVALTVGANSTNGKIPAIALDLIGKLVKVPSNYDPVTRIYSGAWNGTFSPTLQWTDNPAWIIYDLLLADRYGLGQELDEAQIDKWSFYAASVYNDELVNDGKDTGTFEPRFTFNAQLMVQENGWKVLNSIAATMNAKILMHAGVVRIAQDRPATATRIINNSNVVDGMFTYSSSRAEDTITICNVTYSDPTSNFLPRTVSEIASSADRLRHGDYSADIAAYGCSSEAQARRAAKWMIDTSVKQTSLVSFNVSLENAAFEPNEVFYLMDSEYSQTTQEGRLLAISGTTLTLDKPINKTTGTWAISVYGADGQTIESRTITSGSGISPTITIASSITAVPGSVYVVTGAVAPRMFRLISMTDNGDLTYAATALEYDANKYARIETGVINPDPVYWQQPALNVIDRPTNLVTEVVSSTDADGIVYRFLNVSWTPSADGTAVAYQFNWTRDGQPVQTISTTLPYVRVPADFEGLYELYVNAINNAGVASPTLSGTFTVSYVTEDGSSLVAPTSLGEKASGTAVFNEENLHVKWMNPTANDQVGTTLKDFQVRVMSGATLLRTEYVPAVTSGSYAYYDYTYSMNQADGGPRRSVTVQVRSRDTMNKLSPPASVIFTNPAPAVPANLTVIGALQSIKLTMTLPTEPDFKGILVWMSATNGFTPSAANLVYDGSDNYIALNALANTSTYYFRVAAYDDFGKSTDGTGLTLSTQLSTTTSAAPGIQNVASLPGSGTEGDVVFNTTDGKLYRYHAGAWTAKVPTVDLLGTVVNAQIDTLASTKITGQVTDTQIAAVAAAKVTGQLVDTQLAAIGATKITGQLSDSQIAALAATKITGQVTDTQIAAVAAAKVTGQVTDAQVAAVAASKVTGQLADTQIAAIGAAKITGTLTSAQIADLAAAKVTGQITTTQITDNAISTAKLAAGSVQTANLAVGSVIGDKIAANTITAKQLVLYNKDSVDPDPGFYDPTYWAPSYGGVWPTNVAPASDPSYPASRVLLFQAGASVTMASRQFVVEKSANYRVKVMIWKNAGTAGAFSSVLHVPGLIYHPLGIPRTGSSTTGYNNDFDWSSIPSNQWVTYENVVQAGTTYDWLQHITVGQITAGAFYMAIQITLMSGATLIVDGAITANKVAANAITANAIAASTITGAKIAGGTITGSNIAGTTITGSNIAAGTLTAGLIAADAINATHIQASAIGTSEIAAGAVTANEIAAGTITGTKIAGSTITGTNIAGSTITGSNIAGATITGGNIVAGTLTAGLIAADAINATHIQASAVGASEIAAGAVTTEKLSVTSFGDSVLLNPGFEDAAASDSTLPAGWTRNNIWGGTSATAYRDTNAARLRSGDTSLALNPGAGGSCDMFSQSVPVAEGDKWYVSCWAKASGTNAGTSPGFYFRVRGGTYAGDNSVELYVNVSTAENAIVPATWTKFEGVVTIPSGMKWAKVFFINYLTNTGAFVSVDDVVFKKVVGSVNIADGAISAAKIAAGAVTATAIAADTITGAQIAANAITASELAADSVTAGKIAAAQISAAHVVAGSLTGDRMVANTITGDKIAAGTITASSIGASQISTTHLAAGAVTAAKLSVSQLDAISAVIGLLRTAASGGRLEIASNCIKVYDASNVKRAQFGDLSL